MAFKGIYPASELTPAACGLLSVARVMTHKNTDYDERWVRGFSYEFDSQPEVEIFTVNDATTTGGVVGTSSLPQYLEYEPFFIIGYPFDVFTIEYPDKPYNGFSVVTFSNLMPSRAMYQLSDGV